MNIYLKENKQCTNNSFTNKNSQEESLFKSLVKDNYPNESLITKFPNTTYYADEDTNTDSISLKCDMAYYSSLKDIDWNVLLTLKFRKRGFTGISDSASSKRKKYLWELKHDVVSELDLGTNNLQYFCTEEVNSEKEAHFHVIWHSVYKDRCSTERLRETIEKYVDPKHVIIPRSEEGKEPLHVQTIRSQERVIRYVIKKPIFQEEPKTFHLSHAFVRFIKRHRNWKSKIAA
jgi:hypothetical protein